MNTSKAGSKESIESGEWIEDLIALSSKTDKILRGKNKGEVIYEKQCRVFKSLVDTVARDAKDWGASLSEATTRSRYIGRGLLRVLNGGIEIIQLCVDETLPGVLLTILGSLGQFLEIIDDVSKYHEMIIRNCLDLKSVEGIDCEKFKADLKVAYEEDKVRLLDNLKSWASNLLRLFASRPVRNISSDYVLKTLIPKLETGRFPATPCIDGKELVFQNILGKGSCSKVYSATWCNFVVAVKKIASFEDQMVQDQMVQDLMCSGSPHIVQVLGHYQVETELGHDEWKSMHLETRLVSELMDADLQVLISKNKIKSPLQSVDIMLQIGKAMKHLHENDVIHRNLTLSNILVKRRSADEGYLIKLSGFCSSKSEYGTGAHTSMRGTLQYMAPEMKFDQGCYSKEVDVFSFGIVCYKISEHLETPIPLSEAPRDMLKQLIQDCCKDEASKRPTFAEICEKLWRITELLLLRIEPSKGDASTSKHEST